MARELYSKDTMEFGFLMCFQKTTKFPIINIFLEEIRILIAGTIFFPYEASYS